MSFKCRVPSFHRLTCHVPFHGPLGRGDREEGDSTERKERGPRAITVCVLNSPSSRLFPAFSGHCYCGSNSAALAPLLRGYSAALTAMAPPYGLAHRHGHDNHGHGHGHGTGWPPP